MVATSCRRVGVVVTRSILLRFFRPSDPFRHCSLTNTLDPWLSVLRWEGRVGQNRPTRRYRCETESAARRDSKMNLRPTHRSSRVGNPLKQGGYKSPTVGTALPVTWRYIRGCLSCCCVGNSRLVDDGRLSAPIMGSPSTDKGEPDDRVAVREGGQ